MSENEVCVNLLRFYCVYILFLAINGITEGFYNATTSEAELKIHNYRLIVFSVIFMIATFGLAKLFHVSGFLMANCINMTVRIVVSSAHIRTFFSTPPQYVYNLWSAYFPHFQLLAIYGVALVVAKLSERTFYQQNPYVHFFLGVILFSINFLAIFKFEMRLRAFALKFLKKLKIA